MKNHAAHHKDIADILGSVRDRDHYAVIRDFFVSIHAPARGAITGKRKSTPKYDENGHFFRAEFAEFLQKVGKKAEKWRFMQKIITKPYKMYDFPHFFYVVSKK